MAIVGRFFTRAPVQIPAGGGSSGGIAGELGPVATSVSECVAWSVPFDFTTQTTVAWGPGETDLATCDFVDQVVWTAGCNPGGSCGTISLDFAGRVWTTSAFGERVHRYDPADGSTVMTSGMDVSVYGSDMTGWALYNAVCSE